MVSRLTVILLLATLAIGCTPGPAAPDYSTGEFRVTGSASVTHANIYFQAFDGAGMNVLYNVDLADPWTQSFGAVQAGADYFLAAQSNDNAAGALTIEVFVDAVLIDGDTTSVSFGYVAVYGAVP